MDTLGKRVRKIIIHHGETMTSFAKEIRVSQSMVSKICADKAIPSDRTISDICRIYNVSKDWLLHGTGDMVDTQSLEGELSDIFSANNELLICDKVKCSLISALERIPPAAWPLIVNYLECIADECQRTAGGEGSYMDGYREGVRIAQKVRELLEGLSEEQKE